MTPRPPQASDEIVIVNEPVHRLNMLQVTGSEMMMKVLATLLLALGLAVPAFADSFTADQKSEIESIVKSYLLEHPEVVRDAIVALDAKEKKDAAALQADALANSAKTIMHSELDGVIGNSKGDVTVVEFMDYNCGWCRKSIKEMQSLVKQDKNVRVVMKEFPIFGEGSDYAARAAMASVKQGKYWEFHQALFATPGKVTIETVDQTAKQVGLDLAKLKVDMTDPAIAAHILATAKLAGDLQFTGTPGFIIDNKIYPGYIPLDEMMAGLTQVRANGGCKAC